MKKKDRNSNMESSGLGALGEAAGNDAGTVRA